VALQNNPRLGRYFETSAGGEVVRAFIPPPLPPNPSINLLQLIPYLSKAERAIGRLDGITVLLPSYDLFLYMYVRKEAVLSSQIEGTQSTLTDLLQFENEAERGHPIDDIREVSNYVDAMMFGLERIKELPLSLRLIREIHARLLQGGRGAAMNPGEFRRSQNWIGGSRPGNAYYVPPPVNELTATLDAFERFIHESASNLPPLIKAGLMHVQFESIHPFLDGNGRIGRLLVTLYLCVEKVLDQPLLYLSLYLKTHRTQYYQALQDVRERGDWEGWLVFFLEGVEQVANQAFDTANRIVALFQKDRELIADLGASTATVLMVHEQFQKYPLISSNQLVAKTTLTSATVNKCIQLLANAGIVSEITGKKRGRVFRYNEYLQILNEGTVPL